MILLKLQLRPGDNFFNVVVFRSGHGAGDFHRILSNSRAGDTEHGQAVREVAPKYYRIVWIHR